VDRAASATAIPARMLALKAFKLDGMKLFHVPRIPFTGPTEDKASLNISPPEGVDGLRSIAKFQTP
jgi:hypothetical protein